jgi:putative hydrolase of the HAD superfamily
MGRLYIFDVGGVVSQNTNVAPDIAAHLEFDGAKMIDFARDDFRELTTGRISVEEFTRRFSLKSGRVIEVDLLNRYFHPELDPAVVKIIDTLKPENRVVAGTNTIGPHYDLHRQQGDYEIFDAVYASHLIGLAKPDPAFYTHILDQEQYPAERAVFIDDVQANVDAAQALGIRSLLFSGAEQLEKDLAALAEIAD